jgi:flagellar biosynthesis protein FlhB
MSEEDRDPESSTEEATPKKLESLRERGDLAKSAEVTSVAAFAAGLAVLSLQIGAQRAAFSELATSCFSLRLAARPLVALVRATEVFSWLAVPIAMACFVGALGAGLAQTRGYFSFATLERNFEQLDPMRGLARVVPGRETVLELVRMVLKVLAVGWVVQDVIHEATPRLGVLAHLPVDAAGREVVAVTRSLLTRGTVALVALAALDLMFVRWRFARDARMSKKEVSDEHKEQEGDPRIRGKRRARAAKLARQRAIAEVKNATVVVANPTHLAIALRYEIGTNAVPIVLAKGQDELALRMREEARRHGVPVVENRPLARALYPSATPGTPIPVELYEATAHVIAHVMRLRRRPVGPSMTPRSDA